MPERNESIPVSYADVRAILDRKTNGGSPKPKKKMEHLIKELGAGKEKIAKQIAYDGVAGEIVDCASVQKFIGSRPKGAKQQQLIDAVTSLRDTVLKRIENAEINANQELREMLDPKHKRFAHGDIAYDLVKDLGTWKATTETYIMAAQVIHQHKGREDQRIQELILLAKELHADNDMIREAGLFQKTPQTERQDHGRNSDNYGPTGFTMIRPRG